MPGILPMKMIRVGSNSTSRIAQACDRCRSKKIRCDGMRPTCTQCANVGFECKTSDKLSRRAFPRGYTESLEDRVRGLEAEVRELKDLLDERDEKIDMLSRLQSFSRKGSACLSPSSIPSVKAEAPPPPDEILHVEAPAPVHATSGITGPSTTSALIEAFESKVHDSDRQCAAIMPMSLLAVAVPPVKSSAHANVSAAPPRLLSDQYINLFFQEWQPLLPVLHRQTFLQLYKEYIEEPEGRSWSTNKLAVAQLFLIFEIAAHSQSARTKPNTAAYEGQWRKALSAVSSVPTIELLQCHILAQLCYLLKADHSRTLRQRALTVAICQQLGLHRRDRDLSLTRLEAETRKKVFWSAYVLDKFTSITTGMPVMLRDCDISTEYPADIDDENISAQGITQALPGEPTKISSALALFRVSRILGKAYESLYPASLSFSLSLTKLHSLSDELDQWHEELPDHLRLRFCNDKPATHLISDRSPLLSLAYFYTRSLIHRPVVCHGSGSAASAATIVIAAAAKHMVQILDLLDERCMNYTFPSNKQDLLMSAAFSILWQCMQVDEDGKLIKDNQKSLGMLLSKVTRENSGAGAELKRVVSSFVGSSTAAPNDVDSSADSRCSSMAAPTSTKHKSARKQIHVIASKLSSCSPKMKHEENNNTLRSIAPQPNARPRLNKTITANPTSSTPTIHVTTRSPRSTDEKVGNSVSTGVNLDYFPLSSEFLAPPTTTPTSGMQPPRKQSLQISPHASWENLLTDVDAYNTIAPDALNRTMSNPEHGTVDWSHAEDIWHFSNYQLGSKTNVPQSLLSFSEESMSSSEDVLFSAPGSHNGSLSTNEPLERHGDDRFKGIAMPVSSIEDDVDWGTDLQLHP